MHSSTWRQLVDSPSISLTANSMWDSTVPARQVEPEHWKLTSVMQVASWLEQDGDGPMTSLG